MVCGVVRLHRYGAKPPHTVGVPYTGCDHKLYDYNHIWLWLTPSLGSYIQNFRGTCIHSVLHSNAFGMCSVKIPSPKNQRPDHSITTLDQASLHQTGKGDYV